MDVEPDGKPSLEQYREYVVLLARVLLNPKLRRKLDCSDLAQEVLLKAHVALHQWEGKTETELRSWLRTILVNTLTDQYRAFLGPKRNVHLEHSLEAALERSASRLEEWLGNSSSGPEARMMQEELLDQVARAINQLPENQRTAVELFHIHRFSVAEIGQEMGLSKKAVGGLIERGVRTIRKNMTSAT